MNRRSIQSDAQRIMNTTNIFNHAASLTKKSPFTDAADMDNLTYFQRRIHTVIAPAASDPRNPAIASAGLLHPSVFLGLPLSSSRTASTSASETAKKSVPLGKYCLT